MNVKIESLLEVRVTGWIVEAPTEGMTTEIQSLWSRAIAEGFPGSLEDKTRESTTLTLISDWFSEHPAQFLIGAELRSSITSDGLVERTFPKARCAVFELDGRIPNVVENWDAIWAWLETAGEKWTKEISLRTYDYHQRTCLLALPLE